MIVAWPRRLRSSGTFYGSRRLAIRVAISPDALKRVQNGNRQRQGIM
jgi:hypothetical protein